MAKQDASPREQPPKRDDPERGVIVYTPAGRADHITLNLAIVRRFFCAEADEMSAFAFMGFCRSHGLDPFAQEAYLTVMEDDGRQKPVIQTAYPVFMQRAERSGKYKSFKAGVVLSPASQDALTFEGTAVEGVVVPYRAIQGTLIPPGWVLVGGWCQVWRTDRDDPATAVVSMKEYVRKRRDGNVQKMWSEERGIPATMIRKTAIAHAHREAFPGEVGRLYTPEEFPERSERGGTAVVDVTETEPPTPLIHPDLRDGFARLGWTDAKVTMWLATNRALTTEQQAAKLADEGKPKVERERPDIDRLISSEPAKSEPAKSEPPIEDAVIETTTTRPAGQTSLLNF